LYSTVTTEAKSAIDGEATKKAAATVTEKITDLIAKIPDGDNQHPGPDFEEAVRDLVKMNPTRVLAAMEFIKCDDSDSVAGPLKEAIDKIKSVVTDMGDFTSSLTSWLELQWVSGNDVSDLALTDMTCVYSGLATFCTTFVDCSFYVF
jgi:hypothetical protein